MQELVCKCGKQNQHVRKSQVVQSISAAAFAQSLSATHCRKDQHPLKHAVANQGRKVSTHLEACEPDVDARHGLAGRRRRQSDCAHNVQRAAQESSEAELRQVLHAARCAVNDLRDALQQTVGHLLKIIGSCAEVAASTAPDFGTYVCKRGTVSCKLLQQMLAQHLPAGWRPVSRVHLGGEQEAEQGAEECQQRPLERLTLAVVDYLLRA